MATLRSMTRVGFVAGLLLAPTWVTHAMARGLADNETPRPGWSHNARCLTEADFQTAYDKLSTSRANAIIRTVEMPVETAADFRAAYDRFNAAIDRVMHREIALIFAHLGQQVHGCGGSHPDTGEDAAALVGDEADKAEALRAYQADIAKLLPGAKVEELVITDLHLIRAVEVRIANVIFQYVNDRQDHLGSRRDAR